MLEARSILYALKRAGAKFVGRSGPRMLKSAFPNENIGAHSYGGLQVVTFGDHTGFSIGKYCSFATGVTLVLGGEHRTDWVTTYPFPDIDSAFADIRGHPASKGDIVIGNDVWFGREAMVMSGVTIGDGAVIAARALVTRDVPPYAIVAGHPAKILRYRFPEDVVARLIALRWWDWPDERVRRAVPLLLQENVAVFLDAAELGEI